ncbi:MAG: hypothetical protein AB7T49_12130 [Oligoflexales bacterium]
MNKTPQIFDNDALEGQSVLTTEQIILFVENFRVLVSEARPSKSKLISIKVPESLLATFKTKSMLENVPYQTKIKELMMNWVASRD